MSAAVLTWAASALTFPDGSLGLSHGWAAGRLGRGGSSPGRTGTARGKNRDRLRIQNSTQASGCLNGDSPKTQRLCGQDLLGPLLLLLCSRDAEPAGKFLERAFGFHTAVRPPPALRASWTWSRPLCTWGAWGRCPQSCRTTKGGHWRGILGEQEAACSHRKDRQSPSQL